MPGFNRKFDLDLNDMDLIEDALHEQERALAQNRLGSACMDTEARLRKVKLLRGRLHNQKVFFRPQNGPYVGG